MRRVVTVFFSVLLFGHFSLIGVAQNESKVVIETWNSDEISGPVWISLECEQISCNGMELIVFHDGNKRNISDLHQVEWAGFVNSTISWELRAESSSIQYIIETIYPMRSLENESIQEYNTGNICSENVEGRGSEVPTIEFEDLPNLVPQETSESSEWQLSESALIGALDGVTDKDSMKIRGHPGDIIEIENLLGPAKMSLEIWDVQENGKSLIENIGADEVPGKLLEYPEMGELWIRIIHDGEDGFHPYKFQYSRHAASTEGPDCREISSPWSNGAGLVLEERGYENHEAPRSAGLTYGGHISSSDPEGDSLLVKVGSGVSLETRCEFSNDARVAVIIHQLNGTKEIIDSDSMKCPDSLETGKNASQVEFRFSSNFTISWEISVWTDDYGDYVGFGDAPESIWKSEDILEEWPIVGIGEVVSGELAEDDRVDIYAFRISENISGFDNGSIGAKVAISTPQGLQSAISFQIQSLSQTDWVINNSSNGGPIELPFGVHAIRVEGVVSEDIGGEYSFTIIILGPMENDSSEFEDLSSLFSEFYILAGILLLLPLIVVLWWNRGNFGRKSSAIVEIEQHEKRKLGMLRRRLLEASTDEESGKRIIDDALSQLADSAWEGVIQDWGEPLINHNTGNVEIKAWRLDSEGDSLLVGIRIGDEIWDLAAMRIHSPEGSSAEIVEVYPKHLFQDDQIYLGKLNSDSITFFRVGIEGSPEFIGFQLSGLVGGEPFAASPIKAIKWK